MFEKEAEEYARQNNPAEYGVKATHFTVLNSFKDGVEFGYNKANEWHFVKDGKDLPLEEGDFLFYLYDKETKDTFCEVLGIARTYADRDDMHIESMLWTLDDVIAWKEIVLPELKESE